MSFEVGIWRTGERLEWVQAKSILCDQLTTTITTTKRYTESLSTAIFQDFFDIHHLRE